METKTLKLEGIAVGLGESVADIHWDSGAEAAGEGLINFAAAGVSARTFTYNLDGHRYHRSVYPDRAAYWLIVDAVGAAVAADMLDSLYDAEEEAAREEPPAHRDARLALTAALRALFPSQQAPAVGDAAAPLDGPEGG